MIAKGWQKDGKKMKMKKERCTAHTGLSFNFQKTAC